MRESESTHKTEIMAWEYIDLLNECIRILLTIALGSFFGFVEVFDAKEFVPQAVKFIFHVALPTHVIRGIGMGVDFYRSDFLWHYIGIFLALRAVALVAAVIWVLFQPCGRRGLGQVAVIWLSLTWISTVILGIPIARVVFGDAAKGAFYGLLAGISSFIFQLPLQLLLLECHSLEEEHFAASIKGSNEDAEGTGVNEPVLDPPAQHTLEDCYIDGAERGQGKETAIHVEDENERPLLMWVRKFAFRRDVWRKIGRKVLHNPVLWAIVCGFALSLSKIGPNYLNPKSDQAVEGLGWMWSTAAWLGECVSPVSLFTMGLWMYDQGKKMFAIPVQTALLFMISKLFLVPLLVLGLAKAVDLNDEAGRAAVLIAALPISLASFSLGSTYHLGETILSANVAMGTLLMLPTILTWNLVMDALDVFPITK